MLTENVKIGMEVVMNQDYVGELKKGQKFKVLRPQTTLKNEDCFLLDHAGKKSYLAPFSYMFMPAKSDVKKEILSAEDILFEFDSPRVDYSETLYTISDCLKSMKIYRNQGIQQASEVCSEMLTDGFRISNIPSVLALKEEV